MREYPFFLKKCPKITVGFICEYDGATSLFTKNDRKWDQNLGQNDVIGQTLRVFGGKISKYHPYQVLYPILTIKGVNGDKKKMHFGAFCLYFLVKIAAGSRTKKYRKNA